MHVCACAYVHVAHQKTSPNTKTLPCSLLAPPLSLFATIIPVIPLLSIKPSCLFINSGQYIPHPTTLRGRNTAQLGGDIPVELQSPVANSARLQRSHGVVRDGDVGSPQAGGGGLIRCFHSNSFLGIVHWGIAGE
jgi:hypothetical protein